MLDPVKIQWHQAKRLDEVVKLLGREKPLTQKQLIEIHKTLGSVAKSVQVLVGHHSK